MRWAEHIAQMREMMEYVIIIPMESYNPSYPWYNKSYVDDDDYDNENNNNSNPSI
jgi:hypothetical protein